MDRLARQATLAGEMKKTLGPWLGHPGPLDLDRFSWVVIEGTQGYGLGLHTAQYPQVTSSDCRAIDFLGMAGISPWDLRVSPFEVIVVARTFPIRVAGNSGPLFEETTWEKLGLPPEHTTVTNKIRRVGGWDSDLLREAVVANGGGGWNSDVKLAITMLDQLYPDVKDVADDTRWGDDAKLWLQDVQDEYEVDIAYVGVGPDTMVEVAL
jgi:adenylosuccinate synthase